MALETVLTDRHERVRLILDVVAARGRQHGEHIDRTEQQGVAVGAARAAEAVRTLAGTGAIDHDELLAKPGSTARAQARVQHVVVAPAWVGLTTVTVRFG